MEAQDADKFLFDDIIQGKGQGVIMLLVGDSGTGKTVTAEAVPDRFRRPLYVMSAGELGCYADDVEDRLNTILELAEKWNAVLLFDECDVFMQQRSTGSWNTMRSSLFSSEFSNIPLNPVHDVQPRRHNRPGLLQPDPPYPALSRFGPRRERTHLGAFARSQPRIYLTTEECRRLSRRLMNGRQIKNALRIATPLAVQERTNVDIGHIRAVLQATGEADAADV